MKPDRGVACWGRNDKSQVGTGTSDALAPVTVAGVSDVSELALGQGHSCAIKMDRSIVCTVSGVTAVQIAAPRQSTCARNAAGGVVCWGNGESGVLVNGTMRNQSTPGAVTGLSDATQIAAGGMHACALKRDASIVCWGSNQDGELGNGTLVDSATPVPVLP